MIPLIHGSITEFMKKFAKPLSKSPRALDAVNFVLVIPSSAEVEKSVTA